MSPALTLNSTLNSPLSELPSVSSFLPGPGQVAIDGVQYLVDLSFEPWKRQAFRTTSIDPNRQQADTSQEPGESTINPEALWRRSQDTWNHGAGQTNLDRKESDIAMFRASKGVDPWNLWQLTLLPDTNQIEESSNTNLQLASAGAYLYLADGTALKYTENPSATSAVWSTTSGTPSASIVSLCSDGYNVYAAYLDYGVYMAAAGGAATQLVDDGSLGSAVLGYCNGRLMLGIGNVLYNITQYTGLPGSLPSPLMTADNPNFKWVGFAEGNGWIYAAGSTGTKSYIYAITIASDGSALSAPVVAGQLPVGETVTSITGYLGFIVIGTTLGFRVAETVSNPNTNTTPNGTLQIGPLIQIPSAVQCVDGEDRFVYFGWSDFDSESTGLGRMDLTQFPVQPQAPAYAADLMSQSGTSFQGAVSSTAYCNGFRAFAVEGVGVFIENDSAYVPSGWLQSGLVTYGISDNKLPVYFDLLTQPLEGSVEVSMAVESAAFGSLGTTSASGETSATFDTPQELCRWFETQLTLYASSDQTETPTVIRTTARSIPAALTGSNIFVPIRLGERVDMGARTPPVWMDPVTVWQTFEALRISHEIVDYQEGSKVLSVYVADLDWIPSGATRDGTAFNGVLVVNLKEPV